jgi:hypothetical protein
MHGSSTRRVGTAVCVMMVAGVLACGGTGPVSPDGSATQTSSGGSSHGDPNGGGSGGGTTPGAPAASPSGTLSVKITDSPFSDAKSVLVTFSAVSVHLSDGDSWQTIPFTSGSSRTCDLKKLQGPTDVLGVGSLPSGHYTQVRLVVSAANIYFDSASSGGACASSIATPGGKSAPVEIPAGEVKLNQEFTVSGGATTMVLDFDGDKSIKATGSGNGHSPTKYMMTPVVRVVSVQ